MLFRSVNGIIIQNIKQIDRLEVRKNEQQNQCFRDEHVVYGYGYVLYVYVPPGIFGLILVLDWSGSRQKQRSAGIFL